MSGISSGFVVVRATKRALTRAGVEASLAPLSLDVIEGSWLFNRVNALAISEDEKYFITYWVK